MAVPHTLAHFPTFMSTYARLCQGELTCNWYLPDKQRYCRVTISEEDANLLHDIADNMLYGSFFPIGDLAIIVEDSCCTRHHRDKLWRSGLILHLAQRWKDELEEDFCVASPGLAKTTTTEEPLIVTTDNRTTSGSTDQAHVEQFETKHDSLVEEGTQSLLTTTPIEFSRYNANPSVTLTSTLWSDLDPSAEDSDGSVYIFTYPATACKGMIKIGYTTRAIERRLQEWAVCGHGEPYLLDSVRHTHHPKRVELLTHVELTAYRHYLEWCDYHLGSHTEWFEVDLAVASKTLKSWSSWMDRAKPYDRRGRLKDFWRDAIGFLIEFDIAITGALMLWIEEVEEGIVDVKPLLDNDNLRKQNSPATRYQHELHSSRASHKK